MMMMMMRSFGCRFSSLQPWRNWRKGQMSPLVPLKKTCFLTLLCGSEKSRIDWHLRRKTIFQTLAHIPQGTSNFCQFFSHCISIVSLFGLVKPQFIMVKLGPTYSLRLGSACWTGTSIGTHNWDPVWCRDGRPEGAALRVLRHSEGFHDRLEALYQSLAQKGGISTNKKWGDAAPRLI